MSEIRVFSGIQPSGEMHLGNYLGAVRQWVENQGKGKQNFYCIVDLHAHTILRDSQELRDNTRSLAAMLFACGLDPNISTIFIQSQVRAHAEACWLLNCVTPLGWLERMTQYKDKKDKLNSISAALLDYPVLQAGDIILYDANEVPIGEDQKQHVELARDIAQRFNNLFGETFVLPEPVIPDIGARVMNLSNPLSKMSKSFEENDGGVVGLLDSDAEIIKTIKRAVTDSSNEIKFSDLELIFKNLKSLFKKKGYIINWKELEKQSLDQTINTLAMASPFSLEEKQILLETIDVNNRKIQLEKILNTYIVDDFNNTTIQ